MPWTSQAKDISIASQTDHPSNNSALIARPPGVTTINFTPAEFFGAAARCCYLHVINPALVTQESAMIKALVEQHVDNTSTDFAIEKSADQFKDYVKSYFSGTVASGLAYLAMIKDGYTWSDHFENFTGGNQNVTKSPDFVFARRGQGDIALVESKGSRSATSGSFNTTVNDGYTDQVEPHLGYTVGTSTATHGFCIGSLLTSKNKAELNIHYTDVVTALGGSGPSTLPGSSAAVQRNNYATAFRLVHSESLSGQVRNGRIEDASISFRYFDWMGKRWLTANVGAFTEAYPMVAPLTLEIGVAALVWNAPTFALESTTALNILGSLSGILPGHSEFGFDIPPISPGLIREASTASEGGAAIFPDGLAVFIRNNIIEKSQPIVWLRGTGDLVPPPSNPRQSVMRGLATYP